MLIIEKNKFEVFASGQSADWVKIAKMSDDMSISTELAEDSNSFEIIYNLAAQETRMTFKKGSNGDITASGYMFSNDTLKKK